MKHKNQFLVFFSFVALATTAQVKNKKSTKEIAQLRGRTTDHSIFLNTAFNSSCGTLSNSDESNIDSIKFKVVPNPIKGDYFEIKMPSRITKVKVKIASISGQIIKEKEVFRSDSKVFVGDLAKGLYLVQINTGVEELTLKIIKK